MEADGNVTNFSMFSLAVNNDSYWNEESKSTSWKVIVGIVLSFITTLTILGNSLVIISFATDWRLRVNRGNWFIFNLSISDLIIGLIVLPINSAWIVKQGWPFGEIFCKFWIICDYTASYVSVLSMVMISIDRHWLVTKKLSYKDFLTKTKVRSMLVSAWIFSIVFYAAVTYLWEIFSGVKHINYSEECEMESVYNLPFNIILIVIEFAIPLIVIIVLNYTIYKIIKIRSSMFVQRTPNRSTFRIAENVVKPAPELAPSVTSRREISPTNSQVNDKKEFRKHRRAAFTLAVLIGVFILCWLPYYITVILGTCCEECVPDNVWEFTNNLLWCNSFLNPFLYALLHNRYRENFIRLLGLKGFYQRWTLSDGEENDTESTM